MNKVYIGVDPGKDGFVSILTNNDWKHYDIPKIGKLVNINELKKIFEDIKISNIDNKVIIGMEDVHAIYGSSSSATFSFGYVCGLLEGLIVANNFSYIKIQPKKWQKEMWQGIPIQKKLSSTGKTYINDTKLMSKMACQRLFPELDLRRNERCRTPDDNKIDSILIAEYLRRNNF
jgi:hypothetical protein